ncbi:transcriptional regulator [Porticoccaceae bacterium]|jgi:DNA-binding MarR family transcriptional regulator|nr:transcriptional regulator [Porticoccaceae bacterium]MDA8878571.1 transcriptional regulator [Porticoccaceae bacterium]MDA8941639.1 transcriptional regulator [Porticoccaceae bacterium]MDA9583391.1 transcriptional regulator [Porticoccaceae bacterium]MDB2395549.1 transcriptional regulator [Porticoccaceae bacterium]|tara:strand:- start:92 stop:400 length:309 start_codon:yes stop_codon:yes gene_type:complete
MSPKNSSVDIEAIDEVIHGRLRLGIMAYLSAVNPASFPELLDKTGASNGNLSTHLSKLEAAGYVTQEKGYAGKKPQTLVHLTESGRDAWIDYLGTMQSLLNP